MGILGADLKDNCYAMLLALFSEKQITIEESFEKLENHKFKYGTNIRDKEDILKLRDCGEKPRDLAEYYGLEISSIRSIISRERKRASQTAICKGSNN